MLKNIENNGGSSARLNMRRTVRPGARIFAVNRFYWPDQVATAQLLTDLMQFLHSRGWQTTVVTSRMCSGNPWEQLAHQENHRGTEIYRVWSSRWGRDWLPGRAVQYITFYLAASLTLLLKARRGDVFLVTTDPPLFAVIASLIVRVRGACLATWNHDVFPEVATALGVLSKDGYATQLLRWLRNRALCRAELNVVISEGMREKLVREGVPLNSLKLIPNWCDSRICPVPSEKNYLRSDWGLDHAFVIGYSGNLGRAHIPKKVAELVCRTRDLPGVIWLFVGGGAGLKDVRSLVTETGAKNVLFRPLQHRDDLSFSLSAPDLHLVAFNAGCENLMVPSKLYGIMAAGRPTIYLGDPKSSVAREIVENGFGVCLDANKPGTWRESILRILSSPEKIQNMGRRAWERSEVYAQSRALERWESTLAQTAHVPYVELG